MDTGSRVEPQATTSPIVTPDRRLRVFISSTLGELAEERTAAREAIGALRLSPVMFELGARPHPPRALYKAYLEQSDLFVGIYWQRYGWVAPDMDVSGLEDEYQLASDMPKLIYVKRPADGIEDRLRSLLTRLSAETSYKSFSTPNELRELMADDLAIFLTERFHSQGARTDAREAPSAGRVTLPTPRTRLVGRSREIAAVGKLLTRHGVRLVTLSGPGGIGKTRLAIEVARRCAASFPDGVVFASLATADSEESLVAIVAKGLGIEGAGTVPTPDTIPVSIGDRKVLLVLDNFEHLLTAAPLVGDLLGRCPNLHVLVASRAPLRLEGEHDFAVPPLASAVPEPARTTPDAVRLFVDRAVAADASFRMTAQNREAIAEICARLDGIPLAIELTAARARLLDPNSMLERLDKRLDLLTGGPRDAPERQRTLRNTLDWSYELLGPDEKGLFTSLGVFAGSFSLDALEAVCTTGGLDPLEAMASLVDHSLVQTDAGVPNQTRFSMLSTIRDYARHLLVQQDEKTELQERHMAFYVQRALAAEEPLRSEDQLLEMQRLESDYEDIRQALERSLAAGRFEDVADCGNAIWLFWWVRGRMADGLRWMTRALEAPTGSLSDRGRGRALAVASSMAFWQGGYPDALTFGHEAVDAFRAAGDDAGVGLSLIPIGLIATVLEGPDAGLQRLHESLSLLSEESRPWDRVICLLALARSLDTSGRHTEADPLYDEALELARSLGGELTLAICLNNFGKHRLYQNDPQAAKPLLQEALRLFAVAGDRIDAAYGLDWLGEVAEREGRLAESVRLLAAAESLRVRFGAPVWGAEQGQHKATVARVRKDMDAEEFAEAWAEGEAMDLATAAAHVA